MVLRSLMQYKVSVKEISKTASVSYPTAFNLAKKLRRSLYLSHLQEKMKGIVELDEVYVTVGLKGKRHLRRLPRVRGLKRRGRGTYDADKPPIVDMLERGGMVRLIPSVAIFMLAAYSLRQLELGESYEIFLIVFRRY